jgi:SAM-dependent methyltransferase
MPDCDETAAWYAQDYMLSTAGPKADEARAFAYCCWIMSVLGRTDIGTVLEIGSGTGATLRALSLALPHAERLVGCEPSYAARSSGRLAFYRGTIDTVPPESRFDLIVAINVLEHVPHPVKLLSKARDRLRAGGEIVIVCPDAQTPNLELMFLDHLYSYTRTGLAQLAQRIDLAIVAEHFAPSGIGDFRMYRLTNRLPACAERPAAKRSALYEARQAYLRKWSDLDSVLVARLHSRQAVAFGAGQMAALLRTYAPRAWKLVRSVEIDDPAEAWQLGKDVAKYDPRRAMGRSYLLAIAPASQDRLGSRILHDGANPISFDDIIDR